MDENHHAARGGEREGLVGVDGDLGVVLCEIVDECHAFMVIAYEYAHVAIVHVGFLVQHGDLLIDVLEDFFLGCLAGGKGHTYPAALGAVLLLDVMVDAVDAVFVVGVEGIALIDEMVEDGGTFLEEKIVEMDDVVFASPVDFEGYLLLVEGSEFFAHVVEDFPVTTAPSVDALLDVTHEHALVAGGHVFDEEFAEVFPLDF